MGGCNSVPLGPRKTPTTKSSPAAANAVTLAADISTPLVSVPNPAPVAPRPAPTAPTTAPTAPTTLPVVTPVVITVVPAEEDKVEVVAPSHPPPQEGEEKAQLEHASSTLEEKADLEEEPLVLRTMVIMGSGRKVEGRMGDRIGKFFVAQLEQRTKIKQVVDYVDVSALNLPFLEVPQYHYPVGTAPAELEALATRVKSADCFVLISPEYNHSMSPAVANFIAHFSQDAYKGKPSAIAVYSMGPFGGVRAAMQLRALTGECGCDSVPAIFAAPMVQDSLDVDGKPVGDNGHRLEALADKVLAQLEWYGEAYKSQRIRAGTPQ
ncbi:hypothetical protein BASA81_006565 [Batrachochytrium salamandrivorans]|nr:hypothetical protein BASA81_006565 [Batrachochytrium salamandrivorans]